MAVWDGIADGSAGIAASHFEDVFEQTGVEIYNSIGTDSAMSANDGTWGSGLYSDAINRTFMDYGYKSVINFEQQMYHNPHWPHPSGWSPYSLVGDAIRISSSPVDQNNAAEKAWAVRKAYHLRADGGLSTWNDFGGTPPAEWSARAKGSGETNDSPVLFDDYPMLYKSGMLFGRNSYGFGDYSFTAKMPYGANGASADVNLRRATFPALWLLQMIILGRGVNGEPSNDTATPFTNTGKLREPDVAEMFGESERRIHHTAHYRAATGDPDYPFGNADLQLKPVTQPLLPNDADSVFHNYRLQLTPGKLIFLIDGAVSFVVDTPADYYEPLRIYETVPGQPYNVVKDGQGRGKWTGEYQRNPDGSLKYPRYRMLMNLAEGGKYPRDLAKQLFDAGTPMPVHNESNTMDISHVSYRKLITDNPDTYDVGDNNTGGGTDPVVVPPAVTFEDSFKFRVHKTKQQYVNAPTNVRAEVTANPLGFPYKFSITVDQSKVPAGATVTIEGGADDQASIYSDVALDVDGLIVITAEQDGEPPS